MGSFDVEEEGSFTLNGYINKCDRRKQEVEGG